MSRSAARWAALLAITGLVLSGAVSPAVAVSSPVRVGAPEEISGSRVLDDNPYKAGYTATPPGGSLRTARATFVLPELRCGPDHEGVGVGVGSEPSDGSPRYVALAFLHCIGGAPSYRITVYIPGQEIQRRATVGDTVRTSIRHADDGSVIVKSADLTTGKQARMRRDPPGEETNAVDFGAFPLYVDGTMDHVPRFAAFRVRHAHLNDEAAGQVCMETTDPEENTRVDPDTGEVEISAGDLERCGFALRWKSH